MLDGKIAPYTIAQNGDGYTFTATNSTGRDNMQSRASVVCLGYRTLTAGSPGTTINCSSPRR